MAKGTSVFRIGIVLIFRRCWNLVTLCGLQGRGFAGADRPKDGYPAIGPPRFMPGGPIRFQKPDRAPSPQTKPSPAAFLESTGCRRRFAFELLCQPDACENRSCQ